MIDPINITNFNLNKEQLEEVLLFCVLVAGKNAITTAKALDKLLLGVRKQKNDNLSSPFVILRDLSAKELEKLLINNGIGCYKLKSNSIHELVHSNLNLSNCTLDDLVKIHGIGFKTGNFFLLHTRADYRGSCLDTHILKYLRSLGYDAPKSTPQSKKTYFRLQKIFLFLCDILGKPPAVVDLEIWRQYSGHK